MMQFTHTKSRTKSEALLLPFWQGKQAEAAFKDKAVLAELKSVLELGDFTGKAEELLCVYSSKRPEKRLLLLGYGDKKNVSPEKIRRTYGQALRLLNGKKAKTATLVLPDTAGLSLNRETLLEAIADGALLANYAFDFHQSQKAGSLIRSIILQGADSKEAELFKRRAVIASSVYFTRDLVNGNADDVTPSHLVKQAELLAKQHASLRVKVLRRAEIEKEKLGLLAAVGRSSAEEPALILIEYKGDPRSSDLTAIVGKGITYDTGGLCLKPGPSMVTMRDDMAGAAAVLGVLRAAADLKLPKNLIGVIASTENAIGPTSYKTGDVYTGHAGISVEIGDTDAEGRLVLADALSYLQAHYSPQKIIDLATLTGGAIIALGEEVAALCSNDDQLSRQLFEAGERTFERVWRLPLYEEYEELLKSKIADIRNVGPRKASSICGGIFLKRFIKKAAWAHLDIAGVAFPETLKPYQPSQATGFGVRLLLSFLEEGHASKT